MKMPGRLSGRAIAAIERRPLWDWREEKCNG